MDGLEIDGDVVDGSEETTSKDEGKCTHDPVCAYLGKSRGNHGTFALEILKSSPGGSDGDKSDQKTNDNRRIPGVSNTAILNSQDVSDGSAHHQHNAQGIHLKELFQEGSLNRGSLLRSLKEDQNNESRDTSNRQVDVETPSPADVVCESASQKRANNTSKSIGSTDDTSEGRSPLRRSRKGNNSISTGTEASSADASNRAAGNEGLCVGRSAAYDGPDFENKDCDEKRCFEWEVLVNFTPCLLFG